MVEFTSYPLAKTVCALLNDADGGIRPSEPSPEPLLERYEIVRPPRKTDRVLLARLYSRGAKPFARTRSGDLAGEIVDLLNRIDPYRVPRAGGQGVGWW